MVSGKKEDSENKSLIKDISKFTGIFLIGTIVVVFLVSIIVYSVFYSGENIGDLELLQCGDGTPYGSCSENNPYFCENGKLVSKASECGCPEVMVRDDDFCFSGYGYSPKQVTLDYILRSEEKELNFTVYKGMVDYVGKLPRFITYLPDQTPSRRDFKLRNIDEAQQRELLLPFVIEIQNTAPDDKVEQARIAISIVQHIEFGNSDNEFSFAGLDIGYARRPYEVLYDNQGVCGEKSELLAFMLREIGYDIAFFYNQPENHESLGIKCPIEESYKSSGYCFIETTAPSIITDTQINYVGGFKLESNPEVIPLTDGNGLSLPEGIYEYEDALDWMNIRWSIEQTERVPINEYFKWNSLQKKYNIGTEFNP